MLYVRMVILSALAGVLLAGAVYVKNLKQDLETARANVAKMEVAVQTSEASLKLEREESARLGVLNQELGENLRKAEQYGDELRATLQKHNLTHLANTKPGLIEKRMQDATDKLWDDLTDLTSPNRVQQPLESAGTGDTGSN